jgi:hypothetical protein
LRRVQAADDTIGEVNAIGFHKSPLESNAFIAVHGTPGKNTGLDWVSSYSIGVQIGPSSRQFSNGFVFRALDCCSKTPLSIWTPTPPR